VEGADESGEEEEDEEYHRVEAAVERGWARTTRGADARTSGRGVGLRCTSAWRAAAKERERRVRAEVDADAIVSRVSVCCLVLAMSFCL
jgi:hypothetical protein